VKGGGARKKDNTSESAYEEKKAKVSIPRFLKKEMRDELWRHEVGSVARMISRIMGKQQKGLAPRAVDALSALSLQERG
jgi:hypothetical protein